MNEVDDNNCNDTSDDGVGGGDGDDNDHEKIAIWMDGTY